MYKNKYLIIAVLWFFTIPLTAQNNYCTIPGMGSLPEKQKTWCFILTDFALEDSSFTAKRRVNLSTDLLNPDRVFDGKTYLAMTTSPDNPESERYFFRESGGCVYRYDEARGQEFRVCDFRLSEGNQFVRHDGKRLTVKKKGNASDYKPFWGLYGNDRSMLRLQGTDDSSLEDIWIEGIGSVYTGILNDSDFESDGSLVQYVVHDYNHLVEDYDHAAFHIDIDNFKCVSGVGKELETQEDYDLYIASALEYRPFEMEFTGDTLHVRGFCDLPTRLFVISSWISSNVVDLTLNPLNEIVQTNFLSKFDINLPGFKPGTYTIRFHGKPDVTLVCGSATETAKGDVNNDNKVDISDIVAIINVMAGSESNAGTDMNAPDAAKAKADVNHDGKTDISDITAVINIMAGQK
jgi:hypothetical protein